MNVCQIGYLVNYPCGERPHGAGPARNSDAGLVRPPNFTGNVLEKRYGLKLILSTLKQNPLAN